MSIKNITDAAFFKGFIRMTDDGWQQGWHERNGGNLSYRLKDSDVAEIEPFLTHDAPWQPIGVTVALLKNSYFLVTGSGKYFRNVKDFPEDSLAVIEIDGTGIHYRICWGLVNGGRPTSELPTHLMNHAVKLAAGKTENRVIYHAHPGNLIALTFVLPLDHETFTRELWESATECPVVFPDGVRVVPWMVPGGREIAEATGVLMKECDAVVWAHHGLFCSGETFDSTFGLMHTIEKAAEILVKVISMSGALPGGKKRQTITKQDFADLADAFGVKLAY